MKHNIRKAGGEHDIATLLDLRVEAESWLREAGIAQWTEDYADYAQRVLQGSVMERVAWIIDTFDGVPAGTVTLNGPDRDFWTPDDNPDDALYVMKMIVRREHSGQGLGDAILNWAGHQAKLAGRTWLRLDCRRDNQALHRYYLHRGFEHVRTVWPPPRRTESGALFQRRSGIDVDAPLPAGTERATLQADPERT